MGRRKGQKSSIGARIKSFGVDLSKVKGSESTDSEIKSKGKLHEDDVPPTEIARASSVDINNILKIISIVGFVALLLTSAFFIHNISRDTDYVKGSVDSLSEDVSDINISIVKLEENTKDIEQKVDNIEEDNKRILDSINDVRIKQAENGSKGSGK